MKSLVTTPWRYTARQIIRFGGIGRYPTNQVMPWVDLNDCNAWFATDVGMSGDFILNQHAQRELRGSGVWLSQDFGKRTVTIPVVYDEACGVTLNQALAQLTMSGEQFLTADNQTGLRVRLDKFSDPKIRSGSMPYVYDLSLTFLSRNPFIEDLAVTTLSLSGTSASFYYPGTAPAQMKVVLNTNAGTVVFNSSTTAESLSFVSPGGTVIIDTAAYTITGSNGNINPVGTFPHIEIGFPQPFLNTFTVSGGTFASIQYTTKW